MVNLSMRTISEEHQTIEEAKSGPESVGQWASLDEVMRLIADNSQIRSDLRLFLSHSLQPVASANSRGIMQSA